MKIMFIVLIGLPATFVSAQRYPIVITAGFGTSNYHGDLQDPGINPSNKPALTIGLQSEINRALTIASQISWFTISGNDAYSKNADERRRNLSFTSTILEWNLSTTATLLVSNRSPNEIPMLRIYGMAGIGLLYMNPKADLDGKTYELQPLQTEGITYSKVNPILLAGLGISTKITDEVAFGFEFCYRLTFTDYLDDVSMPRYPDTSTWDDPIRVSLSDRRDPSAREPNDSRGEPENNDYYVVAQFKLLYRLPFYFKK